jgi:hypothetical protein
MVVGEDELAFVAMQKNAMSLAQKLLNIKALLMRAATTIKPTIVRSAVNAEDGTAAVLDAVPMVNAEGVASDSLGRWFL